MKNVLGFEPNVRTYIGQLMEQWDRLYELALQNKIGTEGESGWIGSNGRLWLDCLPWWNYL